MKTVADISQVSSISYSYVYLMWHDTLDNIIDNGKDMETFQYQIYPHILT